MKWHTCIYTCRPKYLHFKKVNSGTCVHVGICIIENIRTKRVRRSRPIKVFIWVLFMFSVEGHTEHQLYTETRRETISYKTLITHWNHDWCEYIDDFFIFYFHFKSFNMLIVAVMMKHCSFYKQQAWRLDFCRTCITRRHVSCRWGLSWNFFREIVWYTDCGDGLSWL